MSGNLTPLPDDAQPDGSAIGPWQGDLANAVNQTLPGAVITSGLRSPGEQHALIARGATNATRSAHLTGDGFDMRPIDGMTADQALNRLRDSGIPVTQVIDERAQGTGPHWHFAGLFGGAVPRIDERNMPTPTPPVGLPDGTRNASQPQPAISDEMPAGLSPIPDDAMPDQATPSETWGQSVGHGLNDLGIGAVRGIDDVAGTVAAGIDGLGRGTHLYNSNFQGNTDRHQAELAAMQYHPDGWAGTLGRIGGDTLATLPAGELSFASALPLAGKLATAGRIGDMAAQGFMSGGLTSGGHDVLANAAIGGALAPIAGIATDKALPALMAGGEHAAALVKRLRQIGTEDAADATPALANDAQRLAGPAQSQTIRKGSDLPAEGFYADAPGDKPHLHVNIEGDADVSPLSNGGAARPADVRAALGSAGSRNGLEATTDLPPAVADHVGRLVSQGVPLDQAIREADIAFVGAKPTIAAVTRDPMHQQAMNEGAKMVQTPEGRALAARVAENNASVTRAMQGLVERYGGTPNQGEAAEAAAASLASASDAEKANVAELYKAADQEASAATADSDLKTAAYQREADRTAGLQAQAKARDELDVAQQALKQARSTPGTKGAGNMEQARANVQAARDKLRDVTNNPPKAAPVPPASQGYIDLAPLRNALNTPELQSATIDGGKTLRSGTLGLMDAYGSGADRFTLAQAESIRQAIGTAYDNTGGGINAHVGRLKSVVDDAMDATDAGPSYRTARAAYKAWAGKYENLPGLAKLIQRDAQGNFRNADNWRSAENGLIGTLSDRDFSQVVGQLHANGDTQTLDRVRASILQKAYQAASKGDADSGNNAIVSGSAFFKTLNDQIGLPKLRAIFSRSELADIAATGRAAVHLNSKVPGTANHSNSASAVLSNDMAQRLVAGVKAADAGGKAGSHSAGTFAASSIGGAVATALGHTVLGPVAGVTIPVTKLLVDGLRKRSAAKALKAGLSDAIDPEAARAAAAQRQQQTAAALRRLSVAKAVSPSVQRASASPEIRRASGRALAAALRKVNPAPSF